MMAVNAAPPPAGAGPTGPEGGPADGPDHGSVNHGAGDASELDPIFQGEETVDRPTKRATLLFQFFLFPLLIVVAAVGVFLFFGLIGGTKRTAREYLDEVMQGGENVQKQAAQQLAVLLKEARREETEAIAAKKDYVPFYADPRFRTDLLRAFEDSFPDRSLDRKRFLALAMGSVGDPAYVAPLTNRLASKDGTPAEDELRVAIAAALANLERPEAVPALARLSKDADVSVANVAVVGLAPVRTDASTAALRAALADERFEVKVNAAAALARRGIDDGVAEIEKTLDPAALPGLGIRSVDAQRAALVNAMRAVHALKVERLKPKVEALKEHGDDVVRRLARDVLDRWNDPR
jgi:HEAT repeat protein